MKITYRLLIIFVLIGVLTACGNSDQEVATTDEELKPVSFLLDWTPNTNHTGIYIAQAKGYFEDAGLDVEILLPGEVAAEQLLASGKGDFGVSFQNELTQARSEGIPVVSIGAIIQHSTSGYASPAEKGIKTPQDFEGKVYGAYGSVSEEVMLNFIMEENDADFDEVEFVLLGNTDFFASTQRDIDFVNIFYGWTGIEAEIRGVDLNMIYSQDHAKELNTYSPILVTSEDMIENNPETVEAFMSAVSKGYEFAIDNPQEAAQILIDAVPDLDPELVKRSAEWLAPRYQDDADQWGLQELERWELAINFLYEHGLIDEMVNPEDAFTTDFLPKVD